MTNRDYGACVEWSTNCILHQLEKDGLAEDTLVVFTSDNGRRGDHGGSNFPLRGHKGTTWEGGQRVPCILYWSGYIPAGTVSSRILFSIDFLPTFARLCGMQTKPDVMIDGTDFSSLLIDPEASPMRETFFYYRMNDLEAVREGDWKLHVSKEGKPVQFLYNLKEDLGEEINLYDRKSSIVCRMEVLLEQCRKDLGDASTGVIGIGNRPIGRVSISKPLTEYDEGHPYIVVMYDSTDTG